MKKGLVMEGGAMRGLFTAGVIDVLMENGITFDGGIGTSAGAAFGCNYKSNQIGRTLRYNKEYCEDRRYFSSKGFFKTGNLYSKEFAYHDLPMKYDLFDYDAFDNNPMEFYVTCTNVETGEAVYHKYDKEKDTRYSFLEWVRASCAMPLVQQIVDIDGYKLLDGGVGDSVPLRFFESIGYERNVVILTQPREYRKKKIKYGMLAKIKYHAFPKLTEAMLDRHKRYNELIDYINDKELKGEIVVIRPQNKLNISITRDKNEIIRVYNLGRAEGEKHIDKVRNFLTE